MKTVVFLLILALGFMWYRGDLKEPLHEIESLMNPQVVRQEAAVLPKDFFRTVQREVGQSTNKNRANEYPNDLGKIIREETRPDSVNKIVVNDTKITKDKPLALDIFTKEKSSSAAQAKWLESHKANDGERLMIDKFHKLASEGKWE